MLAWELVIVGEFGSRLNAVRKGDEKKESKKCLVRGICGSLIRSNGTGKVGSRSRRTRCRWGVGLFS
jgi:hypothetical protein